MTRFGLGFIRTILSFRPLVTLYATPSQQLVAVPQGALWCTIRCTGPSANGSGSQGSGGGAWSEARIDVSAIAALALTIGAPGGDTVVRSNSQAGSILCLAKGGAVTAGGQASTGVGDTRKSGGNAATAGGGAAGVENYPEPFPISFPFDFGAKQVAMDGLPASGSVPGDRRGSFGGAGAVSGSNGTSFGGGAGANGLGSGGLIELFWAK